MARDDCHDTAAKALWALVAADSSIGAGDSRDPKYLAEFVAKDFLMIIDKITGELFDTDDIIVQRKTLRTLQALLKTVKPRLAQFTPKVLSVLKSALNLLAVRGEVLETWLLFLRFLDGSTIGPFLSQIVVTLLSLEEIESGVPEPDPKRDKVRDILQFLLVERRGDLKEFFCEIPIVSGKRYKDLFAKVEEVVGRRTLEDRLCQLIDSLSHESPQVRQMGLEELRFTLRDNRQMIYVCLLEQRTHSVSVLHTRISQLVRALLELCSDLDEEHDELAIATAQCFGELGATAPALLDVKRSKREWEKYDTISDDDTLAICLINSFLAPQLKSNEKKTEPYHVLYPGAPPKLSRMLAVDAPRFFSFL
eukprot:956353_1